MSVFRDMARDAGTHIDAGISLDEAAAMHEADYMAQMEQEREYDGAMLAAECEDNDHPRDEYGGCPCGLHQPRQ